MKRLSWKYIAGLIDGEGCIDFMGNRAKYMVPRLRVTQAAPGKAIIDLLFNNFGGYVEVRESNNPNWNGAYTWGVNGKRCRNVLQNIKRHLIIKQNQAEFAIKFIDIYHGERIPSELREVLASELKAMKKDPQRLSDPAIWKHIKRVCPECKTEYDKENEISVLHGPRRVRFCCDRCHLTWLGRKNSRVSAAKSKR